MGAGNDATYTIALTGGTGLVGGELLPMLLARGHSVRCLVRPRPGRDLDDLLQHERLHWIEGRLDEKEPIEALVEGADLILHMAYLHPDGSPVAGRSAEEHWVRTNYLGTMRLLERTASTTLRQMIYVSTLAVYGGDPNQDPLGERFERDEDFPLWPLDFYGAMRAGVEKMLFTGHKAFGINTSIFRLGCVLGLRSSWRETAMAVTVEEALRFGEVRTCHGSYALSARDTARILLQAVGDASVAGGVFNTFDRWIDYGSWAPRLEELLGRPVRKVAAPAREPFAPIRGQRLHARFRDFATDACIEEVLRGLVSRRAEIGL